MKYTYTKKQLEKAVKKSLSITGVLRELGAKLSGGCHSYIKQRIQREGIDIRHFTGQGWNIGGKVPKSPDKLSFEKVLVLDRRKGRREYSFRLRRALIESGVSYQCSSCGQKGVWNGFKLVLEINHKNYNSLDNRRENLEFLCPNCHSQHTEKRQQFLTSCGETADAEG